MPSLSPSTSLSTYFLPVGLGSSTGCSGLSLVDGSVTTFMAVGIYDAYGPNESAV